MAQKQHLHELLKEDQEPFLLNNYISNKRNQLKRPSSSKTTLQLQKKQNSNFPINLCNNTCFISFHNTQHNNLTNSPLFDLTSSPNKTNNSPIFLHIPAKTASLLLDAALRIHKNSKTKPHNSFLGSFFKRITSRTRSSRKSEETEEKVSVKDILRWESSDVRRRDRSKREEEENKGFCNGRTSSAVWSESNEEDKSLDMETSSSSSHSCEEEVAQSQFVHNEKEKLDCACFDDHGYFCESPFRFVLQKSPSSDSGQRTPEFSSSAASPIRHRTQDKENNGGDDGVNKFQSGEEEEDKEQNSPVSVLDPPFDDVQENDDEEGGFDLESGYANVQRTKQLLLDRLRRFEQLAELDPVELERVMLDQEDNEYETFMEEDESETSCEEKALREIVFEVMCHSSVGDKRQDPEDLKRLIYDLIREEEREIEFSEDRNKVIMRRVCRKLELWNEVESNTIDMMIEEDLSREESGRKKNAEETRELASELELDIFGFLVEEFSEDLLEC